MKKKLYKLILNFMDNKQRFTHQPIKYWLSFLHFFKVFNFPKEKKLQGFMRKHILLSGNLAN